MRRFSLNYIRGRIHEITAPKPVRPGPEAPGEDYRLMQPRGRIEPPGDDIGATILEALKAKGMIPAGADVKVSRMDLRTGHKEEIADTGRAEPPRPSIETSWAHWAHLMRDMPGLDMDVPGWAKCRIGNRHGRNGDTVGWVYGIAKGDFGVWISGYGVCYHPQGDYEFADGAPDTRLLAALTHISTGLGLGLFADAPCAIAAAELIQPMIDWRRAPSTDETDADRAYWAETLNKVHRTWEFAGIDHTPHMHAHAFPGGPETGIWAKFADGGNHTKPEKLS